MQLTATVLVERVEIDGAVALVAQDFDKGWPAFFLRRLQLPVSDAQQMHLQRLDEKILGIPTVRTRERQNQSPSRALTATPSRVYRIP